MGRCSRRRDVSTNKYAPSPEAYEFYLKGRFYLNQRTFPEIRKSTDYFQRSIEKDPGFALGYAGTRRFLHR
jgi:hypothetical protein